jgi:hypothetical protein
MGAAPVGLVRGRDRAPEVEALAAAAGGRVGLGGVLADLNRRAEPAYPGRSAAAWAFAWDREDSRSPRWWPQGITSSADAGRSGTYDGRRVLVTTSYAKVVGGVAKGCRISVVDVTDPARLRYRHVLLVRAALDRAGRLEVHPVRAHAGGVTWAGGHLHVAATARGLHTFALDDVVAAGTTERPDLLGPLADGRLAGLGHRYLLPLRCSYAARTDDGAEPFRYSFLSRSHGTSAGPELVAGEYGHGSMSTRLMRLELDPGSGVLLADPDGRAAPLAVHDPGVERMQGAVDVDGRLHVTTSAGPRGHGSLWAGPPDALRRHPAVLPPGPEDLAFWPDEDRLWTLTEYPGSRWVLALDRSRFG